MKTEPPTTTPPDGWNETLHLVERHVEDLRETDPRDLDIPLAALRPDPARDPARADAADHGPARRMRDLAGRIAACTACPLHRTRTRTVPGQGHPGAEILFLGEGPGREEDAQGLAFVGRAGALLTRLITRMGYRREDVFIGNVVKCRPTADNAGQKDRPPTPAEMDACRPFLLEQIESLRPKVIVTLGNVPVEALTGRSGITRLRGQWLRFAETDVMPTFHPSYLLRGGGEGHARYWEVWDDMCEVLRRLGRPVPDPAAPRPGAPHGDGT